MMHMNPSSYRSRPSALRSPSVAFRLGTLAAFGTLGLCASGCGQHFDLGEIAQRLELEDASDPVAIGGRVLFETRDDLDVIVEAASVAPSFTATSQPIALGDVDGDGFGDWIQGDTLFYGTPRPEGRVLQAGVRARFRFELLGNGNFEAAGDVNGDGLADILFGSEQLRYIASAPSQPEPRFLAPRAPAARLVLGSRERLSGDVDLASIGVAFGEPDPLSSRFADELASDTPDSYARQESRLRSLGDLDGDGFADFALTTAFFYVVESLSPEFPGLVISEEVRREAITTLHYGASDVAALAEPAAWLDADVRWSAAGDLDADGRREALWTHPSGYFILPGRAQRHQGELTLDGALAIDGITPQIFYYDDSPRGASLGDLDGDGFDDLALSAVPVAPTPFDVEAPLHLFYGAPDLLAGPLAEDDASAIIETRLTAWLSALGDWNGDGRSDLLLQQTLWADSGDPHAEGPLAVRALLLPGEASRFSGKYLVPQHDGGAMPSAEGTSPYDISAVPAGDLDADGFDDLFVIATPGTRDFELGIEYGRPAPMIVNLR
jgi:hypothetical protein